MAKLVLLNIIRMKQLKQDNFSTRVLKTVDNFVEILVPLNITYRFSPDEQNIV